MHIARVNYFHFNSKTESLYCQRSETDFEAHSVHITRVIYFHYNSKTESLYCPTSETDLEAHSVHLTPEMVPHEDEATCHQGRTGFRFTLPLYLEIF